MHGINGAEFKYVGCLVMFELNNMSGGMHDIMSYIFN